MNEKLPPSEPVEPNPPSIPPSPAPVESGLSPLAAAGIGAAILVVSTVMCLAFPPAFLVGLVGVIVTLFKKGYRCIFLGYIITLGIFLLCAIGYCSIYPPRFD